MIFADKIIRLRRQSGWSQEELAEQMNVTRQSVSKWEGAQAVPDLEKIVRLSELFGVSTDYLLKDELEVPQFTGSGEEAPLFRRVTMEEADRFLAAKAATAAPIAGGVLLCILSPICLFVLTALSEVNERLSEGMACGAGMIALLLFIAAAVADFIFCGSRTAGFEYLEKEIFETEYGVVGMVRERQERYKPVYTRNNVIGVCVCILSLIPLFSGLALYEEAEFLLVVLLSVTLALAGVGVTFLVRGGIIWESFDKLLQEGDYTRRRKKTCGVRTYISAAYWLIFTAIFLGYSLATDNWRYSWIIWVVAGVLFPAAGAVFRAFTERDG